MAEVNITINVGEEETTLESTGIKKKVRKLKNGREVILETPDHTENPNNHKNILNMMGF